MIKKLSIGTAQFGLDYGISNSGGQTSQSELNTILTIAKNQGIETLDTARAYGNSELAIGRSPLVSSGAFQIVTKIADTFKSPEKNLVDSLKNLGVDRIYGLLAHNFDLVYENPDYYNKMCLLKNDGKVSKVGVSLYTPSQLQYLIDNKINIDIVQLPYSILDQRFSPYFDELKKLKIEIHVRSVFLQGLLFMKSENVSPYFIKILPVLHKIREISNIINVPISALALNFALLNNGIEKVIVGCNNSDQFNENIITLDSSSKVKSVYEQLATLGIEDENILLPYNWKL